MSVVTNVAAKAASLLSRGAATDRSHGRKPVGRCRFEWSPVGAKESQESVAPTVLIVSFAGKPRAFARGYDLSPLRGSDRMRFARHLGHQSLSKEGNAAAVHEAVRE
jgi:hypothetical protein